MEEEGETWLVPRRGSTVLALWQGRHAGHEGNCGLSVGVSACVCGGGKEWKKREKHGWCQEEGVACGGGGGAVWKVHKAYGGGEAYRSLYRGECSSVYLCNERRRFCRKS